MDITRKDHGKMLELEIAGRLDAYWADHLSEEISTAIREGRYAIRLNLSGLTYISSAGIRVLVKFRKQLQGLEGVLSVVNPSDAVMQIFKLMRLDALLTGPAEAEEKKLAERPVERRVVDLPNAFFEVQTQAAGAMLACRALGDPSVLSECAFAERDCRKLLLPPNAFAIGLGALGRDFADCQSRFGEFIAIGGAVAYQPTDRGNVPDYLIATGDVPSEIHLLYGLRLDGEFSHVVHFESKPEGSVSLLGIVSQCLDIAKGDAVGIVMVAEAVGLVGAALKRSPALAEAGGRPFRHPEVRDWMTFTAEPAYGRNVALVAGVAAKKGQEGLDAMVRPLGEGEWPKGHFHAAAFSYRPLKKRLMERAGTIRTLFEEEILRGILHLLNDARPIAGAGQSEFVRGVCWVGPISTVASEKKEGK